MRTAASVVVIYAACLISTPTSAQTSDSSTELVEEYRCVLSAKLRQVYETPSAYHERDRYLVLSFPRKSNSYVQCAFVENRSKLYCEASSGYYAQSENKPRLYYSCDEKKKALEALGFKTGNDEKNFSYERELKNVPDFDEIARLMLRAMHDGFGTRAGAALTMKAPFAKSMVVACKSPY